MEKKKKTIYVLACNDELKFVATVVFGRPGSGGNRSNES